MSGVMTVGVLPTKTDVGLALVNYGALGNSAPSSKEMQMCVLVIHP
jgi:hypothetical protein